MIFSSILACQSDHRKIHILFSEEELAPPFRITISTLGDVKDYELIKEEDFWVARLNQPVGSFAYINIYAQNKELYSGPLVTSNENVGLAHFALHPDQGLLPVDTAPDVLPFQLLWGTLIVGIFCSLLRRSK